MKLNQLLSDENNCVKLAQDPIFVVFEHNLINEIKRHENEGSESLSNVLVRIFQLNYNQKILKLSNECVLELTEYLFQKYPSEQYAKILTDNKSAQDYLKRKNEHRKDQIDKSILVF